MLNAELAMLRSEATPEVINSESDSALSNKFNRATSALRAFVICGEDHLFTAGMLYALIAMFFFFS